jgi:uncharacterized protein YpmS
MDFNLLQNEAAKNGIFALLFTALLICVLYALVTIYRDSKKREDETRLSNDEREKRYISTIETLSEALNCKDLIEEMAEDIKEMQDSFKKDICEIMTALKKKKL